MPAPTVATMTRLADLLPLRPPGVAPGELETAEAELGHRLPADVRAFLLESDGSGWVDFPQCGLEVLSLADARSMWALPEEERSGPQRLVDLASDGSRERFCFDPESGGIVMLDITWEVGEPLVQVANTLTELAQRLAAGWDPFSAVT